MPACPPEIARWLHDEVVQRLAGVVAAIGSDGDLQDADRMRCRVELETALAALRAMLNDRMAQEQPKRRFRTVAEAVRAECEVLDGDAVQVCILGDETVSAAAGRLVADFVTEAIRNAGKHARARLIVLTVTTAHDSVCVATVNDGVGASRRGPGAGAGLRLLAARALDHGGFIEAGPIEPHGWSTKLTLTRRSDRGRAASELRNGRDA